jgi:hypothetical protein
MMQLCPNLLGTKGYVVVVVVCNFDISYSYFVHSRKDILPPYLNKSIPRVVLSQIFFMFDQIYRKGHKYL